MFWEHVFILLTGSENHPTKMWTEELVPGQLLAWGSEQKQIKTLCERHSQPRPQGSFSEKDRLPSASDETQRRWEPARGQSQVFTLNNLK